MIDVKKFTNFKFTNLLFLQDDARQFYDTCLGLVETYVKHNTGRLTEEVNAEEDSFHDMLLFMDLLSNLLTKEIIDLSSAEGKPSFHSMKEV